MDSECKRQESQCSSWYSNSGPFDRHTYYTGQEKKKKHSLLKFLVILIVLTLLTPNMTTKLPYHPPVFREGIELKNYICNKK